MFYQLLKNNEIQVAKSYLQAIGLSSQLIQSLSVRGVIKTESESFPLILNKYEQLDIEMNNFQTMPMLMCFLGVEKSLNVKTAMLVNRKDRKQNSVWYELIKSIQHSHQTINSVYLDWCLAMSFTGIDKKNLGTSNWIITLLSPGYPYFIFLCLRN